MEKVDRRAVYKVHWIFENNGDRLPESPFKAIRSHTEATLIEQRNLGKFCDPLIDRRGEGTVAGQLAPLSDWTSSPVLEHVVQFYESDTFLLDSLSGFIGTGLREAETCVVVATKAHRKGVEERLGLYGIDLAAAKLCGQYVSMDAGDTLSRLMVDDDPSPSRFADVMGGVIEQAAKRGHRVRIFGEMVALLWATGNKNAALRLEDCWNDLKKSQSFSLFCAYPINGFDGEIFADGLSNICTSHARVIPAESYSALNNVEDRLRNIIELQQKARLLEAEIGERKQAEEQLKVALQHERLARAEAEAADRLKDEFLATVSHELRTPLNAIIGWSYMIRSKSLDEATLARAMETIERNAKSQAQLIEDILDVSRVITGKLHLENEPVDMVTVINAAIDSVQLAADSKGIQLEVTLLPSSRHVIGDSTRLQQVVWNLLSNSIKFTPAGGRVEVRLKRAGSKAQVTVSDTGEGIDKNFLPYIFDRFRQADGASTRRHGGLGLGLAIVRHLVELHGGTVHADSRGAGSGATFTIRLPLATRGESAKSASKVVSRKRRSNDNHVSDTPHFLLEGVRVLVVDNDPDTLSVIVAMLADRMATVQTASSVADAFEKTQMFKPHVLVADLAMRNEEGFTLIEKIKTLGEQCAQHIPGIALTACVRVDDRARALSAGFNMFVPKPVVPDELVAAIATLAELGSVQLILPES